jgi:hypothetical protein
MFSHRLDEFGGTVLHRVHEALLGDFDRLKSFVGDGGDGLSRE